MKKITVFAKNSNVYLEFYNHEYVLSVFYHSGKCYKKALSKDKFFKLISSYELVATQIIRRKLEVIYYL